MEEPILKKKYNLFTGIAMVVGISIGSGIFIKSHTVLENTNGSLLLSLLAWLFGGFIMIITSYVFSIMASRVVRNNGAVDYFEEAKGRRPAFYLGWYFATVYYPILVGIVGYVTSGFFLRFCGLNSIDYLRWILTIIFILSAFLINTIAPKIAGYLQLSTTFIKLIPIILIVIVGIVFGIINHTFEEAFNPVDMSLVDGVKVTNSFGKALIATAFSYEGWIIATSINAEMNEPKKNLPKALVVGSLIVVCSYVFYNFGLSLILGNTGNVVSLGEDAPVFASKKFLGPIGPYLFYITLIISCLGTLNGLCMACARGMYSLAVRDEGICPKKIKVLHPKFNISIGSSLIGFVLTLVYLLIWFLSFKGYLTLEAMDELSITFVYISYIFIYIFMMKNYKDLNVFKRFIMPILATICALFIVLASTGILEIFINHDFKMLLEFLSFLCVVIISFIIAYIVETINNKKK